MCSFNQGLCPIFCNSSATYPLILSCHIFRIPFIPSAIISFGSGAFSNTAKPLAASNLVYNPRYSGKCIASHLGILFADMLCCFRILSRLYTKSLISAYMPSGIYGMEYLPSTHNQFCYCFRIF